MTLSSDSAACLDFFLDSSFETRPKDELPHEIGTRSPSYESFAKSVFRSNSPSAHLPTEFSSSTVSPAASSPPLVVELPKNVSPKYCLVCGESASGYHYDVPSCNGCKTFFRRTLVSQARYQCKKDGKCFVVLPKLKRCSCRACRFQKCVEVGMNPLAIHLSEDVRSSELLVEVLGKRKMAREQETPRHELKLIPSRLFSVECPMQKLISSLEYLEVKTDKFRKCRYNPNPFLLPNLEDLLQQSCSLDIADRVGPMPGWSDLTPRSSPPCPFWGPTSKHWLAYDLLGTIEYAKTFPFFHKLSQADRIALMRAVALMCFNLTQSFFSYSNKSDQILHPDGTLIPRPPPLVEVSPIKTKSRNYRETFLEMKKQNIHLLVRNQITKKEYILMKAMILCNSSVATLSDHGRNILESEKQRLSQALLSYCLIEFGSAGPSRYASALGIIDCLETLAKNEKDIHVFRFMTLPDRQGVRLIQQLMD